MAKFTVHTIETAPAASKPLLETARAAWGFVSALHGTLAESPAALEALDTLFALVSKTSFTPAEQQAALLAVSVANECEYCTAGHTYLARASKLDEAAIAGLREATHLADPRLQALRTFAEVVVRERGFAGDGAVDAFLAAGFTRAQVLEVILIVATKTITNYTDHLTHTPKESFMADPALAWTAPRNRRTAA